MARTPVISQNRLDKLVSWLSPTKGLQRYHDKAKLAVAESYFGASKRRTAGKGWKVATGTSADDNLRFERQDLIDRSRDLQRNNPLAVGAINTKCTSIIGGGLRPNPEVDWRYLGITEEQARAFNDSAKREFKLFANNVECDLGRSMTFDQIQNLTLRSHLESGDVFAIIANLQRAGSVFDTKIQLVESDRCSNENRTQNTATLFDGVQKSPESGAPTGYWFASKYDMSLSDRRPKEWVYREAFTKSGRRRVLHVHRKLRVGQTRGIPELAPVLEAFKQLGRYTEGELMAAVVGGMFTVFVQSESGTTDITIPDGSQADDDLEMGHANILGLRPGEEIKVASPGRPNTAFDPFVLAIIRQIGVALEIPYELMIKHFTASYSAARAALLEAWRGFKARRKWFATQFCQPVYESVIDEAVAAGRLKAPGYFKNDSIRQAYLQCTWFGDAPGEIDPLKAAKAQEVRLKNKTTTLAIECIETNGSDWQENIQQRKIEIQESLENAETSESSNASTDDDELGDDKGELPESDSDLET